MGTSKGLAANAAIICLAVLCGCFARDPQSTNTAPRAATIVPPIVVSEPGRGGSEILTISCPPGFQPVAYSCYDRKTGMWGLRANRAIVNLTLKLKQPRKFVFLELWEYDQESKQWRKLAEPKRHAEDIRIEGHGLYSNRADQVLINLTDRTGLYWAKWLEDGVFVEGAVYCGHIKPVDLDIAPAPEGMVIAGVPHDKRAEVTYVPDPLIYCRTSLDEFGWGNAIIRLGMAKEDVLKEIERSGLPDFNGRFGISAPSDEMRLKDVWRLSYGCMTGAAPGGGGMLFAFREGRLAAIVPYGPPPA